MKARLIPFVAFSALLFIALAPFAAADEGRDAKSFIANNCLACHDAATQEGGLDLSAFDLSQLGDPAAFARAVKVHDRIASGEMPPADADQPGDEDRSAFVGGLSERLLSAEASRREAEGRTAIRRMTRAEYENTVRDLFDLPGAALQNDLPGDGSAHGFDKNDDALDVSHVNLAKYLEAADKVLDLAITTRPQPPVVQKQRISLANKGSGVAHVMLHGDAVMLKNKAPDPNFPPAGAYEHLDQGAHERMGMYQSGSSVGLFRHEDESFQPYFLEFATLYPGRYRIRTSLWAFQWDKGSVLPSRGTEVARLTAVQLSADGRHTGHPSRVLGYYDAPSLKEQVHELTPWLNYKETIGFNAASLATGGQTRGKDRAMGFTGPGIACDWLEVEGPLHDQWPPESHRVLFGDLPLVEFRAEEHEGVRPPKRTPLRQEIVHVLNRPDPESGIWTVGSEDAEEDADRLLASFLPKAFRRPVDDETRAAYLALVQERLAVGDCFETAMRYAYRAALGSPDFLYHVEPAGPLDDHAVACRLSYFLWNSTPDAGLLALADAGKLQDETVLREQTERMLADPRSERLVEDFLGQWLDLRKIAANDPDRTLYPEFSAYLQDSMLAESRAFFRELLDEDLPASAVVRSNFATINEKLAVHYGMEGVVGSSIRRVDLSPDSPRGGFLAQAAVLKVTANGTTTSPVPRGAFVTARILGQPPEPPPPNTAAIEPDVRGATTIRDQLDKHRVDASCAFCHVKIDPPGFALESFDVIGGYRERYRSIGEGDPAPRGAIDPFIGIGFRLGPAVDHSGILPDGRTFDDVRTYRDLLAEDERLLLTNLARQFAVYSTGRAVGFADRAASDAVVDATLAKGGGIRTLIVELVASSLFREN
ncbi:MAG TPA: DUF1592 domain-containing protein [Pirellulaceae bacterium]|jgi:mono/diheme cytochrome c family protein|nr:DUF1592 domain-containing protein [Pirellulaceae bacterium]